MDIAVGYAEGTQAALDRIHDAEDAAEARAEAERRWREVRRAERSEPRRVIRWIADPEDPWGGTPVYAPGMAPAE